MSADAWTRFQSYKTYQIAIVPEDVYEKLAQYEAGSMNLSLSEQKNIFRSYVITVPWFELGPVEDLSRSYFPAPLMIDKGHMQDVRFYIGETDAIERIDEISLRDVIRRNAN